MAEPLVLASASPRRHALLGSAGVEFVVRPAHIDESPRAGEAPKAYVRRVAGEKASAIAGERVLSADTIVVWDARIFGKPESPEGACAMLRELSGQVHIVYTAVHLRVGAVTKGRVVASRVRFRPLSDRDIAWYVGTGEPLDKAGSYGLQGYGALLVDRIWGSYTNVMGLPLEETLALLRTQRVIATEPP